MASDELTPETPQEAQPEQTPAMPAPIELNRLEVHGILRTNPRRRKKDYQEADGSYDPDEKVLSTAGTKGVDNKPSAEALEKYAEAERRRPTTAELYEERNRLRQMPWVTKAPREKAASPQQLVIGPRREPTPEEMEAEKIRQTMPFPLQFRPLQEGDVNFVFNAWMRSYRDSMRDMRNAEYFHGQQNLISELAKRRQIVLGVDGDTPEFIVGFIVGVPLEDGRMVVDYAYVKHAYRERGIGRSLLTALGWTYGQVIFVTHRPRGLEAAMQRYNATYNPYFNNIGFSEV